MKKPKVILFDFDGVLADTHDLHYSAMSEYFNVDLDVQQFKDMHNGNFFAAKLPAQLEGADWSEYSGYITEIVKARAVITSDKAALVRKLAEVYPLYIITSGIERGIQHLLEQADVSQCFQRIMGFETSTSKVEKMRMALVEVGCDPTEAVFVTDTLGDILEGHEVGIGNIIAVTFGYHTREHLEQGKPHDVINSFEELQGLLPG